MAGVVSGAVGVLVLIGWTIDSVALKSVALQFESMKPNAAVAFIFTGVSLWLASAQKQTRFGRLAESGCAAAATGIGVLTTLEYLFGWSPGFDQWLFRESVGPLYLHPPGRPGLNTALCFSLFGGALLMNRNRSRAGSMVCEGLALSGTGIAFVAVLGYLYDQRFLYGVGSYTVMALHTALTLVVAGVGIFSLRSDQGLMAVAVSEHAGGYMLRRLLPGALIMLPAVGWVRLWGERNGYYDSVMGLVLFAALATGALVALLWWVAASLNHVDHRRRQGEAALRSSDERFRRLFEDAGIGMSLTDLDGRFLKVNRACCTLLGYSEEELLTKTLRGVLHPDDLGSGFPTREQPTIGQSDVCRFEKRCLHKAGHPVWVAMTMFLVTDNSGRPAYWVGQAQDITARRDAEQSLCDTVAHLRTLIQTAPLAAVELDGNGNVILWNDAAAHLFGWTEEEVVGRELPYVPEGHEEESDRLWQDALLGRSARNVEIRRKKKNGELIDLNLWSTVLRGREGRVTGSIGFLVDITARKQAEEALRRTHDELERRVTERTAALRESEARYSSLVSQATDIIYMAGVDGRFTFVNDAACAIMGYRRRELLGKHYLELIRQDFRETAQSFYKRQLLERNPSTYLEFPTAAKDGREIWFGQHVRLRLADDQIVGVEAIARDITERKRNEEELRRSQDFIASVVEHLPNMIFVKDARDLRFVQFNRAGEQLLGYSRSELIGKCDHDFFPRDEAEFFTKKDRDVLEAGRLVDIPEEPIQTKHQGVRILHTKKIPLYDGGGQPRYLLGISEDITESKEAARLLEERAKCSAFSADVSLMLNRDEPLDRLLQYCADAAVRYLGVAFTRIWLRGPGDLCTDCHKVAWCRDQTECLHLHASAGLSTNLNGEYRRIPMGALKIGHIAQGAGILFTNDVLRDDRLPGKSWMQENGLQAFAGFPLIVEGQVFGVLALFSRGVISEAMRQTVESVCNGLAAAIARKHAETALQLAYERLRTVTRQLSETQEAERRRIARELHDEFGQILTGLKFDAAWLVKRLSHMVGPPGATALAAKAAAMSESVDGLIRSVRDTAAALRPGVLDDLGLVAAIEWLVGSFRERTRLPCELAIDPEIREKIVDAEVATTAFRSAQELLTNVMRHAQATSVSVTVSTESDRLTLKVTDNGRGIQKREWQRAHSLGLRGLQERVRLLGGTAEIIGAPGVGTEVTVSLPLHVGEMQSVEKPS